MDILPFVENVVHLFHKYDCVCVCLYMVKEEVTGFFCSHPYLLGVCSCERFPTLVKRYGSLYNFFYGIQSGCARQYIEMTTYFFFLVKYFIWDIAKMNGCER